MKSPTRPKPTLFVVSLLSALAFFVLNTTLAQAGTFDAAFGSGGKVITNVGYYDNPLKTFILSDGKILVAGETAYAGFHAYGPSPMLARYNSDGSLDTSFGNAGVVDGGFGYIQVKNVILQPDGKIVFVGGAYPNWNAPPLDFVVVRYNSDGSRDSGFGSNGVVITSIGAARDVAGGVIYLPDGKLLVAGSTAGNSNTPGTIDLVRYNSDGTLDSTFGEGGVLFHFYGPIGNFWNQITDMVALPDGKFIARGYDFLARFNSDGSFDNSYGTNGVVNAFNGERLTMQPDGKILIGGFPNSNPTSGVEFSFSRVNIDGSPDTSFGVNGTVTTHFRRWSSGFTGARVGQVILKSNGEIIVVGKAEDYFANDTGAYVAAHYTSNGTLIAKTVFAFTNEAYGTCAAIQPDGKIVLAGYAYNATFSDIGLARLTTITNDVRPFKKKYDFDGDLRDELMVYRTRPDGASSEWYNESMFNGIPFVFGLIDDIIAPGDYNDDGITDLAVFRPSTGFWYYAPNPYYASTEFTGIHWGIDGDIPAAGDYDGDGITDFAVFRPSNGVWYILNSETGSSTIIQWGTNGDKPVVGDYDGDGKCDLAVFRQTDGYWYIMKTSDSQSLSIPFGTNGDIAVQADYNGDNKTDLAVFRPSTGTWYTTTDLANNFTGLQFGISTDIPVPADYDGDGKTDISVWRPSNRVWYKRSSINGSVSAAQWGLSSDRPVPGN